VAPQFEGRNQPAGTPQHDYSFILEPATPPPKPKFSMGGSSTLTRSLQALGVVVVLLVAFVIVKDVLGSSGGGVDTAAMLTVAADQQELVHLVTNVYQKPHLSSTTINSSVTIQLTATDSQRKLLAYLKQNGTKTNVKELATKANPTLDTALTAAQTNGTFDQTYQTIMKSQLNTYELDLKTAYAGDKGVNGRALLSGYYDAAKLLLDQLSSPAS